MKALLALGASLTLMAALGAVSAHAQPTTGRMFDTVTVSPGGSGQHIIRIELNCRIQYLSHFPADASDELRIQLSPFRDCPEIGDSIQSELVRPQDGELAGLIDVAYEGPRLGGPQVILHFNRAVNYAVEPGADFRSLTVRVWSLPRSRILPAADTAADRSSLYAINLESRLEPVAAEEVAVLDAFAGREVYVTEAEVDGKRWQRLRLGFYGTEEEALEALDEVARFYPQAWVTRVGLEERALARRHVLRPAGRGEPVLAGPSATTEGTGAAQSASASAGLPRASDEDLRRWLDEARTEFTAGNYSRAIQLYTKVLRFPDHPYRADAQEWLALSRERNGQIAHAKAEYERYLAAYPDGEGAERVRQRLAGLITAARTPSAPRAADARTQLAADWDTFGSVNQYYYRTVNSFDENEDTIVTQSSLVSNLDFFMRRRGERFEFASRINGGYLYDMLDEGPGNTSRVNTLYLEATDQRLGWFGRLGRQTRNSGGVFGRFDGAHLALDTNDTITLNAVAGYPVDSAEDAPDSERWFAGASVDLNSLADSWDVVAYAIQRQIEGITDRQAVGMELRYFDGQRSLLALVDHDVSYARFNNIQLLGNWRFEHLFTVNASYDYRRTPLLSTRNALIGQPVAGFDELLDIFTEDELRDLAEDRTGSSKIYTVGLSRPLFERFQVSLDTSMMQLSGTPESGGVAAVPESDNEFFYNFQLIGSGLLREGDVSILSLRYADATSFDTASMLLNTRFPVTRAFRINPRFRLDRRVGKNDDTTRWITAPSLRMEYRFGMHRIEFEGGGEWSTMELTDETDDNYSYFFNLGYRADF